MRSHFNKLLVGGAILAVAFWIWILPDGRVWWHNNRPDVVAARRAQAARDVQRLVNLATIEEKLADYARAHRELPSPRDYDGDDGDNWDVSTKKDFLKFLKDVPTDPINRAVNDPCNDADSFGYGYSVTNTDLKDPLKRTYIVCAQLESPRKVTERRRSLGEILNLSSGAADRSIPDQSTK